QVRDRAAYNSAMNIHAADTRTHGDARLVAAHVGFEPGDLGVVEVWRIGQHYFETPKRGAAIQNIEAIGAPKPDAILDAQAPRVPRGHSECVSRNVQARDASIRRIDRYRDR